MSSDEDSASLMAAFKRGSEKYSINTSAATSSKPPPSRRKPSFSPEQFISDGSSTDGGEIRGQVPLLYKRKAVAVRAPPVRNRSEYTYYEPSEIVQSIVRKSQRRGKIIYEVKLIDGNTKQVS